MSVLALLLAATTSVRVLVPIVGSVVGANDVRWKTGVQLQNDTHDEMFVALRLPAAPDSQAIAFTLPPGATQTFSDVVNEAFGIDAALSPLEVETMGKRSVRVTASVYAVSSAGVTKPEPIPIAYADSTYPVRTLNGLSFSDTFRTNIGLVNLSDRDAEFTLAVQRISGRNIAVARLTIPPSSLSHTSIQTLFPLIAKGDDFMVVIETSAPNTYVYGSVIDNTTSDARFIQPTIGAPEAQYGILTAHE
ncbi:MAG TPA: hypothetical protein VKU62_04955 [Thermoanaerobaculia bacterium]|nr:hypothetical protein [Thermoanaerobaculia bacterium]